MLNTINIDEKTLIMKDVLYRYLKHDNFWMVLDHRNKPVGMFKTFREAYAKKDKEKAVVLTLAPARLPYTLDSVKTLHKKGKSKYI